MLMPDVNVLVYAHRADTAQHRNARKWLEELAGVDGPFALSALTATGFVRVVTGKTVFASDPSPLSAAMDFVDELMAAENCRWVSPGPEHWKIFSRLCLSTRSTGKNAADAQHAAIALENGCTFATADGDFKRFVAEGLRWNHLAF